MCAVRKLGCICIYSFEHYDNFATPTKRHKRTPMDKKVPATKLSTTKRPRPPNVLATKRPIYKKAQIQNVPSYSTFQLQNAPYTKCPSYKKTQETIRPKLSNSERVTISLVYETLIFCTQRITRCRVLVINFHLLYFCNA